MVEKIENLDSGLPLCQARLWRKRASDAFGSALLVYKDHLLLLTNPLKYLSPAPPFQSSRVHLAPHLKQCRQSLHAVVQVELELSNAMQMAWMLEIVVMDSAEELKRN